MGGVDCWRRKPKVKSEVGERTSTGDHASRRGTCVFDEEAVNERMSGRGGGLPRREGSRVGSRHVYVDQSETRVLETTRGGMGCALLDWERGKRANECGRR